ncbi:hypothetical protein GQ53DRAFT_305913 [Thozetella sp. PMI_491]|nr:hypothetical protein GQ53DRAFT_305913 [Thozetella sp. PMI_491]
MVGTKGRKEKRNGVGLLHSIAMREEPILRQEGCLARSTWKGRGRKFRPGPGSYDWGLGDQEPKLYEVGPRYSGLLRTVRGAGPWGRGALPWVAAAMDCRRKKPPAGAHQACHDFDPCRWYRRGWPSGPYGDSARSRLSRSGTLSANAPPAPDGRCDLLWVVPALRLKCETGP